MLPISILLGNTLNQFALLVAVLLIISFSINVGLLNKIGAQIPMPLPSISNAPAVRITFPHHLNNVSLSAPLSISGISSDNELTDCKVSVIVNNVKPYQEVVASGKSGMNDYSNWGFTLNSNYTSLSEGSNKLTSKISCLTNSGSTLSVTKWFSVNVTGVRDLYPSSSNYNGFSSPALQNSSKILPQAKTIERAISQPDNSTEKTLPIMKDTTYPVADAGQDQIVKARSIVNLNAAHSKDSDGTIVSYSWIQLSGNPTVALRNADSPVATFEIPDVKSDSKLSFRLTVVDNDKLSGSDTVNVIVKRLKTQNQVPKDDTSCDEIGITNLC
jgi:K319-like protein